MRCLSFCFFHSTFSFYYNTTHPPKEARRALLARHTGHFLCLHDKPLPKCATGVYENMRYGIIPTPHVVRLERVFTIAFCPFWGLKQVFLACFRPFFQYIPQIGTPLVRQKCTKISRFCPEIILFYSTIDA